MNLHKTNWLKYFTPSLPKYIATHEKAKISKKALKTFVTALFLISEYKRTLFLIVDNKTTSVLIAGNKIAPFLTADE